MSTLSSSSTLAEVQAAYDDNASYAEDGSVTKCKAFITACRILMRRVAVRMEHGTGTLQFESLRSELDAARRWLAVNGGGGAGVKAIDLSEFR